MKTTNITPPVLFAMLIASTAFAQVPAYLPVQGVLADDTGAALNGAYSVSVALYESPQGGTALFDETQTVDFDAGAFTLYAGDQIALDWSILDGVTEVWIGLSVAGDAEMTPRLRVASVPWAAHCKDASTIDGLGSIDLAQAGHSHDWSSITGIPADIADGDDDGLASRVCQRGQILEYGIGGWGCGNDDVGISTVGTADIVDGAVTTPKLAASAVTSAKIATSAVTSGKIANAAVTNANIATAAITNAKLGTSAVTSAKIAPASVGPTQLGGAAVTASKIASNAVRAVHIANGEVTAQKIGFNAVGSAAIGPNAVGSSEIANASVTSAKLSLNFNEYCVLGTANARTVTNQRLCTLNRIPSNVECRIARSGSNFTLSETPSGPNNCCMFCF